MDGERVNVFSLTWPCLVYGFGCDRPVGACVRGGVFDGVLEGYTEQVHGAVAGSRAPSI